MGKSVHVHFQLSRISRVYGFEGTAAFGFERCL